MDTRLILALLLSFPALANADEYFTKKIEPLLRKRCFECHSHESSIEAGLALDSRSGWEKGGDSGPAVIPGKPDKSLLLKKVSWLDEDHQMPPEEKLPEAEIKLLTEWVKRGAPDPRKLVANQSDPLDWWSLKPLKRPAIPKPTGQHPIDAFVRHQLSQNQLQPSPKADRRTLIRRAYVDLHGLIPSPEAVEAFVDDPDEKAWEKLVDKLLASPRYGERWARHWLDVIHFADSHGCEHDVKRPNAWRFRDYVIQRLNADVLWDRFIREQLAADALYPNEPQLTAALGFISAGPLELSRAGTAPVTFDYLDRDDIVTQTMAAFTSTTANCARCHTHKFDPITQEDYYALQAVFAGVGKGDIEFDQDPAVMRQRNEWNQVLAAVTQRDSNILLQEKYASIVNAWEDSRRQQTVKWTPLEPEVFVASGGATLTRQDDGSIYAGGHLADLEVYTVTAAVPLKRLFAIRLDVLKDIRLPHGGPGRAGNGNLHVAEVEILWFTPGSETPQKLKIAYASADYDQPGWTAKHAIDGNPQTGWAIYPKVNESHHIVFELANPIDVSAGGKLAISLKQLYPPKHIIGRFRLSVTDSDGPATRVLPVSVSDGLKKPQNERSAEERTAIAATALESHASKQLSSLPAKSVAYGVSPFWSHATKLAQRQKPKVVHLLRRGDIDKPIREVLPGSLSALKGLPSRFELSDPDRESERRVALANWIAHKENPLTWRSIANRTWHYHFGRGLSETPNDFGRMGSSPTHPELLDWLAIWLRDDAEGSLKKLHKLILTSETWKQSTQSTNNANDVGNRLLWRMNRRRLDAETIRDSVLQISGRLDLTMGGPGIEQFAKTKGPQATPALDYSKFDWNSESARRRSIYRVVWRGIPDPFMETMDFPDMALLSPKRGFSVSALQSLALFNNDFILHGSKWIAANIEKKTPSKKRINRAIQLCWQREPTPEELDAFEKYVQTHGLPAFCRVLLNSNAFLFVD